MKLSSLFGLMSLSNSVVYSTYCQFLSLFPNIRQANAIPITEHITEPIKELIDELKELTEGTKGTNEITETNEIKEAHETKKLGYIDNFEDPEDRKEYFVTPWNQFPDPLEWQVKATRNKTITVRGTLQDVRAEALKHNPNWGRDYPPVAIDFDDDDDDDNVDGAQVKRDTTPPSGKTINAKRAAQDFHIDCGRFESVEWMEALHEVGYLHGVDGKPTNGPGFGACTRVSCAYNTAVVWCNDVRSSFIRYSSDTLGLGRVLMRCT